MQQQVGICGEALSQRPDDDYIIVKIPGAPFIKHCPASIIHAIGDAPLTDEEKKFVEDEFEKVMAVSQRYYARRKRSCVLGSTLLRCVLFNIALFTRDPVLRASFHAAYDTIHYNYIHNVQTAREVILSYIPAFKQIEPRGLNIHEMSQYLHHKFHL